MTNSNEGDPTLEAILYDSKKNQLKVLDQLLLPSQYEYLEVNNVEDGWRVIRDMNVRY